jgi:DNA-binding NarL/FixJ family response regulator
MRQRPPRAGRVRPRTPAHRRLAAAVTGRLRVLVVDDDVATVVGIVTILGSDPGIEVVGEAATGAAACELVKTLQPDVVVLDVQLPDIDGITVSSIVTQPSAGFTPPKVLIVTTFAFRDYAVNSARAGASGFLLKRASAEELIRAVHRVARGETLPLGGTMLSVAAGTPADPTDAGPRGPVARLTSREQEVLVLVAIGLSNQDIERRLFLSADTVKTHLKRVYAKLGCHDRARAVIAAYESGLVSPGTAGLRPK